MSRIEELEKNSKYWEDDRNDINEMLSKRLADKEVRITELEGESKILQHLYNLHPEYRAYIDMNRNEQIRLSAVRYPGAFFERDEFIFVPGQYDFE